jgi:hypothetical protein
LPSIIKVDQIQSDLGTVNVSSNLQFSSGFTMLSPTLTTPTLSSPTLTTPTITGQATIPTINLTGGQIVFPATQNASSDANTLDDYEEGAWTPTISGSSSGTVTTGTRYGSYTKIGRMVYASFHIVNPSLTSIGGTWRLSNLPFTSTSTYMSSGKVAWKRYIPVISNGTEMTFYMVGGTAVASIGWGRNTTDESDYITGGSVAADTLFEGFLIYQANA